MRLPDHRDVLMALQSPADARDDQWMIIGDERGDRLGAGAGLAGTARPVSYIRHFAPSVAVPGVALRGQSPAVGARPPCRTKMGSGPSSGPDSDNNSDHPGPSRPRYSTLSESEESTKA